MPEAATNRDTAVPEVEQCRFIPVRKRELLDAVLAHPLIAPAETRRLTDLGRRLALVFHLEFFAKRDRLKDAYVRFNPDQPGDAPIPPDPGAREAFFDDLDSVLMAANFRQFTDDDIVKGLGSAGRTDAKVEVPREVFDTVRFYGRGRHTREITVRSLFGLRRKSVETALFHDIVFVAALRSDLPEKALKGVRLRAGAIYLKLFRDIPEADLNTLYPNARVVMKLQDQLILGVPALVGGIPILLKIVPALSVLFIIVGAYLGVSGTVEDDAMKQAVAAFSGLGALGAFLMRQWIKYERQKLKYQKQVADNAYFNTVNNNAGMFDALIGASEDSEVKEACLAYAFLHMAKSPLSESELNARIVQWLSETFGVEIAFDIEDAVAKLRRIGLITETCGRLTAVPLESAVSRCEEAWFQIARVAMTDGAPGTPTAIRDLEPAVTSNLR